MDLRTMLNNDPPVTKSPNSKPVSAFSERVEVSETIDRLSDDQISSQQRAPENEDTRAQEDTRRNSQHSLGSINSANSDAVNQVSPIDANPRKRPRPESRLDEDKMRKLSNGSEVASFVRKASEGTASPALSETKLPPQIASTRTEASFLNIEPYSEIVRVISDFVFHHLVIENIQNIELEAKLGRIIDKSTNERLQMHILTEAVLETGEPSQLPFRFESDMTSQQHKQFNQTLNKAFESSQTKTNPARVPMSYKHTRETDNLYESNGGKLRITTDQKTQKVLATVSKERVADLNILSPRTPFDWRVSISTETPVSGPPPNTAPKMVRHKDRVSYIHQHYQMDLTQVGTGKELKHELEVEFNQIEELKRQGASAIAGRPNKFEDMISGFVNSVRLLCRPPL